jgi:hypothetical protein
MIEFTLEAATMSNRAKTPKAPPAKTPQRVKLRTWDEVEQYKAKQLKPRGYGPKGCPIYDFDEVCKLNIEYPDEK